MSLIPEGQILRFPGPAQDPGNREPQAPNTGEEGAAVTTVTAFLTDALSLLLSGQMHIGTTSSVAIVVFTPGQGPWIAFDAHPLPGVSGGQVMEELAAGLRDGARGYRNGDDPTECAVDAWRQRDQRHKLHLAATPWICEICGERFRFQGACEEHESRCAGSPPR